MKQRWLAGSSDLWSDQGHQLHRWQPSHLPRAARSASFLCKVFSSSNFQLSLRQTSEDYLSLVKKQWWVIQRLLPCLRRPPHLLAHLSTSPNRQYPPILSFSFSSSVIPPFFHSLFFSFHPFSFPPTFLLPSLNIDTSRYDCLQTSFLSCSPGSGRPAFPLWALW